MLLLRYLKSYLPAHSILRGFVALHLCDFADAVRAGCAEAKLPFCARMNMDYDAIRAGCAEAKEFAEHVVPVAPRCNPCGMFRNERKVIVFKRLCAEQ